MGRAGRASGGGRKRWGEGGGFHRPTSPPPGEVQARRRAQDSRGPGGPPSQGRGSGAPRQTARGATSRCPARATRGHRPAAPTALGTPGALSVRAAGLPAAPAPPPPPPGPRARPVTQRPAARKSARKPGTSAPPRRPVPAPCPRPLSPLSPGPRVPAPLSPRLRVPAGAPSGPWRRLGSERVVTFFPRVPMLVRGALSLASLRGETQAPQRSASLLEATQGRAAHRIQGVLRSCRTPLDRPLRGSHSSEQRTGDRWDR